ncbi:uncharacterized protein LOC131990161 [Centropristis striata]|uniref:uncharacterized protein LOC131990161 n=1 Tax=Centropristis striata TaxID=184440 RepID=UPI0027E07665|nr:uncharacterized protein LOC131990161 [Centropristis striata]
MKRERAHKPEAGLRADSRDIPVGGRVTLSCSVTSSSGWKFFWYRGEKTSEPLTKQDAVFISTERISVSQGGVYWCRGGRGETLYYTDYSHSVLINNNVANRAVVTLQPNWSEIYRGETITVRCDIKDGGDTEWEYEWKTTSRNKSLNQNEHRVRSASESDSGTYSCRGRRAQQSATEWSDPIKLTVSDNQPEPVLTVSPSWLSPGDSVTLNCRVKHPSAGWRFSWYKAVPKPSDNSYSYELLPDSTTGTEQDSDIVHGQTHTAGYVCRAGRGDPVYHTDNSQPQFVWSGDFGSSASLTVSPDRVQHFTSDSVSLSCEGNSTEWRVKRFTDGYPRDCPSSSSSSSWGTMTGSTCNIHSGFYSISHTGVHWCESRSGEFSNAVNITKESDNIILVSPVHPVTEGDSVSLSCRLRRRESVSTVFFYRNEELVQNDTRRELNISAVSKSDEGFYKCGHSGEESAQSWMSVKEGSSPEGSKLPVLLITGLLSGIALVVIIILLVLFCYRRTRDSSSTRPIQSESTNQGSATSHMVDQNEGDASVYETIKVSEDYENDADESQDATSSHVVYQNEAQRSEYSSLLHCDASVYETIKGSEDNENDADESQDATSSHVVDQNEAQRSEYSSLLHCDASVYETIKGSEDYENDAGESKDATSSSIELKKIGKESGGPILESPEFTLYEGDGVVLSCKPHDPGNEMEATFIKGGSLVGRSEFYPSSSKAVMFIGPVSASDRGSYTCQFDDGKESEQKELKVEDWLSAQGRHSFSPSVSLDPLQLPVTCRGSLGHIMESKPKAGLRADSRDIPVGGRVTLSCSVTSSSGWKFFWYRGEKTSEPLTKQDAVFISTERISVSQGGVYWCRGGRGETLYYTDYSHSVLINNDVANRAVVTLQPNWSEIYRGETITVRCDIKDGGDTEWEYEWKTTSRNKPSNQNEHRVRSASGSDSGTYSCRGRRAQQSATDWSDPIKLTVSDNKPEPVLTVSPSWLSPGDSVTLNCRVKHPSAGWRFSWYKAVPKPSDNSYSYELLPDSTTGTEQDSYIVHGQTHTAGYVCRAGRGDPVYHTDNSQPQFVWSGDFGSSASLTVSPDRVQHFTSDSVSLSCEGNSAEWRVKRFTDGYLLDCSTWGTMTGSTCNIHSNWYGDTGVYWCESRSGEFSNAVNITQLSDNIILVSPVHPVTEGDSVSLSCRLRRRESVSTVFFYRNEELVQNDTRRELNISAVSKSDEGFYKCGHSGEESAQSWMSVKGSSPEGSKLPVLLITGLVCGIALVVIIILLVLFCYRRTRDSSSTRPIQSESTNQGSATSHMVYQNEAQRSDASVYETIKVSEDYENVTEQQ